MGLKILFIIISYFAILFMGCKPKSIDTNVESFIFGEWKLDYSSHTVHKTDSTIFNIIFKEDKKCNIYPSFYSFVFEDPRTFITYLGSNTDYKIEAKLLKIYNLARKNWDQFKIMKLTSDTLIIETSLKELLKFKKVNKKEKFQNNIDAIVLNTSGLYNYHSNYKIYLDKSGEMLIELNGYDDLYGTQSCILDKRVADSIFSLFEYNRISDLKSHYNSLTDSNTLQDEPKQNITLAFFSENRITKEIDIIDDSVPIDLYMAYDPIRTIYKSKNCHCKTTKIRNDMVTLGNEIETSDEQGYIKLSNSGLFYLNFKILTAKEIEGSIQHKYKIKGSYSDLFTFSDGRFIRIEGSEKIYDVGYWFIDSTKINYY
jgi:hypothetical protein